MVDSDLSEYRDDLVAIESRVAREVETGWRGPAIAAAVTVLVVGLALPHTGTGAVPGWSVATAAHSGAGIGLMLTWAAMAALAVLWIPIVTSRSNILPPPGDTDRP